MERVKETCIVLEGKRCEDKDREERAQEMLKQSN